MLVTIHILLQLTALLQRRHESNFQVTDTKTGSIGRKQWETKRVKTVEGYLEQSKKNIVGKGAASGLDWL